MSHRVLILAAGLLAVLASLGWQIYGLRGIAQGHFLDDGRLKLKTTAVQEAGVGLEQIAALHLFGNAAAKPAEAPMPAELPKTDLKLQLVGAITDSDTQHASALIQAEKLTKRYFVGDQIPGGAVLHEVLADSVILKRENRYETLSFPKGGDAVQTAISSFLGSAAPVAGNPVQPAAAIPPPRVAPSPQPAGSQGAPAAGQPTQDAAPKGLTLRDRLQRVPRFNQPAAPQK